MKVLIACLAAWAAAVIMAEEPELKAFQWRGDDGTPKVAETGRLTRIDDPELLTGTPRGTLAALVSRGDAGYEWTPSDNPAYSSGGAMLCDVAPAPDESAILMLERVGRNDGPFGSRLVLFNLYNSKIPRVWSFPDRRLVRFAVLPGARRIYAVQQAQEALGQDWRIVAVPLRGDGIELESEALPGGVSDWCFDEEHIFVKSQTEPKLRIFAREDLKQPPRVAALRAPGGRLLHLNGDMICNVTPGLAEYGRFEDGEWQPVRAVKLPADFVPDFAVAGEGEDVVTGQAGGDVLYIHGDSARKIASPGGNAAVWNRAERYLVLHEQKKNMLSVFRLPGNLRRENAFAAAEARPRTLGEVQWLFAASGKEPALWVVDRRCNIYLMTAKGKRWRKTLLRSAD